MNLECSKDSDEMVVYGQKGKCFICHKYLGWYDSKFINLMERKLACYEHKTTDSYYEDQKGILSGFKYWTDG